MNIHNKNKGFSLIEVMIAMLIGILLMTGAVGLFISNKRIYKEHDAAGRLQENARFATNLLIRDIRMAGYVGCVDDFTYLSNNITATETDLRSFTDDNTIEGFEGSSGNWLPSGAAIGTVFGTTTADQAFSGADGTDGITLRFMKPLGVAVSAATTATAIPSTFDFSDTTNDDYVEVGELVAVSNCGTTDIFVPNNYRAGGGLQHAGITNNYDDTAEFSRFVSVRYYIRAGNDADGDGTNDPALWRTIWDAGTGATTDQELIEGVEDLEIMYGVDSDDDTFPNGFYDADNVAGNGGWNNVVTVKIAMQFRTVTENFGIDQDSNTYSLLDKTATGPISDYRRRRVVTTSVQIRNRVDAS